MQPCDWTKVSNLTKTHWGPLVALFVRFLAAQPASMGGSLIGSSTLEPMGTGGGVVESTFKSLIYFQVIP